MDRYVHVTDESLAQAVKQLNMPECRSHGADEFTKNTLRASSQGVFYCILAAI